MWWDEPSQQLAFKSSTTPSCNLCEIVRLDPHLMTYTYYFCNGYGNMYSIQFAKKQCQVNSALFRWSISPGEHAVLPDGAILPTPRISEAIKPTFGKILQIRRHCNYTWICLGQLKQVQNFVYNERKKLWTDNLDACNVLVHSRAHSSAIEPAISFWSSNFARSLGE